MLFIILIVVEHAIIVIAGYRPVTVLRKSPEVKAFRATWITVKSQAGLDDEAMTESWRGRIPLTHVGHADRCIHEQVIFFVFFCRGTERMQYEHYEHYDAIRRNGSDDGRI